MHAHLFNINVDSRQSVSVLTVRNPHTKNFGGLHVLIEIEFYFWNFYDKK